VSSTPTLQLPLKNSRSQSITKASSHSLKVCKWKMPIKTHPLFWCGNSVPAMRFGKMNGDLGVLIFFCANLLGRYYFFKFCLGKGKEREVVNIAPESLTLLELIETFDFGIMRIRFWNGLWIYFLCSNVSTILHEIITNLILVKSKYVFVKKILIFFHNPVIQMFHI